MRPRRLVPPAAATLAAATLALAAAPVSAAVTYDPEARTGFVGAGDVRAAFGWSGATLAARAPHLGFTHEFWTDDTYRVTCAGRAAPVVHHREYGNFELADTVVRQRGGRGGYRGTVTGFRITGARAGISGTSVPPEPGQPCPHSGGATVDRAELASTTTGWALVATSGELRRELLRRGSRTRQGCPMVLECAPSVAGRSSD